MSKEKILYTGHLLIIMSPSGAGKGTLVKYISSVFEELVFPISCTTRDKRPGETNGVEYYFLTKEEFKNRIEQGDFLEWAEYGGNLYGSLISELIKPLKSSQLIVKEIEWQGVQQLKDIIPPENMTVTYVDGGDWVDLVDRIKARAPISEAELKLREERYQREILAKPQADIIINNQNGNLAKAKDIFHKLVADILKSIKT